jgi:hypothetical protein
MQLQQLLSHLNGATLQTMQQQQHLLMEHDVANDPDLMEQHAAAAT